MMMTKKYTIVTRGGRRLPLAAANMSNAIPAARAVARASGRLVVLIEDDSGRRWFVPTEGFPVEMVSPPDDRLAA